MHAQDFWHHLSSTRGELASTFCSLLAMCYSQLATEISNAHYADCQISNALCSQKCGKRLGLQYFSVALFLLHWRVPFGSFWTLGWRPRLSLDWQCLLLAQTLEISNWKVPGTATAHLAAPPLPALSFLVSPVPTSWCENLVLISSSSCISLFSSLLTEPPTRTMTMKNKRGRGRRRE